MKDAEEKQVVEEDDNSIQELGQDNNAPIPNESAAVILKHSQLGPKQPSDPLEVLIETETFANVGKMQPFTISASSSALLVVDIFSHLCNVSVCG